MNTILTELPSRRDATIVALSGGRGLQARLRSLGLSEGQKIRKVSKIALGGPVVVEVNRSQVAIGRGMARRIVVSIDNGPQQTQTRQTRSRQTRAR